MKDQDQSAKHFPLKGDGKWEDRGKIYMEIRNLKMKLETY